jgi:hypothetical protein
VPQSLNLPLDTTLAYGSDSTSWTYRAIWAVRFDDSTSGATIRSVLDKYEATIIGGTPPPVDYEYGSYIVRVPEPLSFFAGDSILALIRGEPGVQYAHRVIMHTNFRPFYRTPNDGSGLTRSDWRQPTTSSYTEAWKLVRAPEAWGCETGLYGGQRARVGIIDNLLDSSHPDLAPSFTGSVVRTIEPAEVDSTVRVGAFLQTSHGTALAGIIAAKATMTRPQLVWSGLPISTSLPSRNPPAFRGRAGGFGESWTRSVT